jgi:RiboL-PSP-HEPN
MKPKEIHRSEQRLDNVINLSKKIGDLELQSHFARYLCILLAGYIEKSIEAIFTEYARKKSAPSITNYVAKQLEWNLSVNMEKAINIARQFDNDIALWIEAEFAGEIADSVNSIKANRDNFAHGGFDGISLGTIISYHDRAREFVDKMCQRVIP